MTTNKMYSQMYPVLSKQDKKNVYKYCVRLVAHIPWNETRAV